MNRSPDRGDVVGASLFWHALEEAALVITDRVGRVRACRIGARRLQEVAASTVSPALGRAVIRETRSSTNNNGRRGSMDAFFGRYIEVTPSSRIAWTNEESGESGSVTTVTFEEKGGQTLLVMSELYPSKEALDAAGAGGADATNETFAQLDEVLVALPRGDVGRKGP
jgi:hypothetical protein